MAIRYIEHNRAGQEIVPYRGQERAPRDGYQVQLTIDLNLQNIVENEIDAAMREYAPQKATIILMRPETGEILAMANRPAFRSQPALRRRTRSEMKNRAIIDMMEPGSTFKIVTAAAALNEKKVRPESTIFCENGVWNVGGRPLHDHHGYGAMSVQDILIKSSNIGAAKLAVSVGEQKFYEYIRRFGFGERTGIELPGEIRGIVRLAAIVEQNLHHPHSDGPRSRRHAAADGDGDGRDRKRRQARHAAHREINHRCGWQDREHVFADRAAAGDFAAKRRRRSATRCAAWSAIAARRRRAAVPGFTVCGKTGTAQKVAPKGGYEHGKYVVSFSGYMPAEHPAFVGAGRAR